MAGRTVNYRIQIAGLTITACLGLISSGACAAGYWYQITPPVQYVAGQPKVLLRAPLHDWILEQSSSFATEQDCEASKAARMASSQAAYMQAKEGYDRAGQSNIAPNQLAEMREMTERANATSITWNSSRCIRIDDPRLRK